MNLLIDTDAFCKLGVSGLLSDAALVLGTQLQECGRLHALPYMLRKGSLRTQYGADGCDALIPLAESMTGVQPANDVWLERLSGITAIDPGEAQIFSVAAELGLVVMTGDKRALRAIGRVADLADAIAGRVVVLEAVLLALCDALGVEEVRRRTGSAGNVDKVIAICFSPVNSDPRECLRSYYRSLTHEVAPLVLWDPTAGVAT